jgi:Kef-type K+ transport system membrane component KefB
MSEAASPRPVLPVVLYALTIIGAVGAFLVIRAYGIAEFAPTSVTAAAGQKVASHGADLLHVLIALVTVVALARGLGTVFRLIQQPPVVGEILAGILLGPSLLGHVAPGLSAYIFPAGVVPALNVISQVGVILFMFLVGVELDVGLLRKRGHATVAISHASIIAPFLLGALLSLYLYPRLSSGSVPFTNFALFLGVSMSVTAFPVLARILTDRRISRTRLGALALTCAAVDDVTAWCLLALVVGVARAESVGVVRTFALVGVYIAVMALVARPLMRRLTVIYGNKGRLSQGLMATLFVMLLLSASATEVIGIHAIFGAFALGAIIPHDSGMARELTDRLEDLVVVLLLPAFFAFTGLRTQIGLLNGGEQWMICGLIIAVASIGKFGGSLFGARVTGLGWRDGAALGVLMNTRGLMELIVLNIGYEMHVISPVLFAMMVLMALVTTFATTPILHVIHREATAQGEAPAVPVVRETERSAILVPIANPAGVGRLVRLAIAATPPDVPPPRVLAMVRPPAGGVRTNIGDGAGTEIPRSAALSAALELAWSGGFVVTPQAVWSDDPAADLLKIASDARIGWMLLGPHRAVFGADFRGGVVRTVMDRARELPLNVAVVMQEGEIILDHLFVVADHGPDGRAALELGTRLAQGRESALTVLHMAGPDDTADPEFMQILADAARLIGKRLHTESIATATLSGIAERTRVGFVIVASQLADELGVARRGFPDGRPMVLVQGSRLASRASGLSQIDQSRSATL